MTQSSGHAGTTTATVLTRAILSEGCKSVAAGMNPMDLRRGINLAVEHVLADLKGRAKMISTTEEIAQVLSATKPCSNLEYNHQTALAAKPGKTWNSEQNQLTALQACIAACPPLTCQQCNVNNPLGAECMHSSRQQHIAACSTSQHASHCNPVPLLELVHLHKLVAQHA